MKPKLKMIAIKMSRLEYAELKFAAELYAKGNLSAWLRHAGRHYQPKKSESIIKKR